VGLAVGLNAKGLHDLLQVDRERAEAVSVKALSEKSTPLSWTLRSDESNHHQLTTRIAQPTMLPSS
jgi:hypothetical protein